MSVQSRKCRFKLFILCLVPLSLFLGACSDMLMTADGSYSLAAYVGLVPLSDGSIVASSAEIQPRFLASVGDDPDVQDLQILLKRDGAAEAHRTVRYELSSVAGAVPDPNPRQVRHSITSFDRELASFTFGADASIGLYTMTFQVLGRDGALIHESVRHLYFLGDARLVINSLQSFPPGAGGTAAEPLLPLATPVLLSANVEADKRLDPYFRWTLGNKVIAGASLSEGGNRVLWTTPETGGMYTVKLEVLPEAPTSDVLELVRGVTATITLACDPKAAIPGLRGKADDYYWWYRFLGTLRAEQSGLGPAKLPDGVGMRWGPLADNYGLEIDHTAPVVLDVSPAQPVGTQLTPTRLALRLAIRGPGIIAEARLPLNSEAALGLRLTASSDGLALSAALGDLRIATPPLALGGWGTVPHLISIDVCALEGRLYLRLGADGHASAWQTMTVGDHVFLDMGSVRLGGTWQPEEPGLALRAASMVLDEIALSSLPWPSDEELAGAQSTQWQAPRAAAATPVGLTAGEAVPPVVEASPEPSVPAPEAPAADGTAPEAVVPEESVPEGAAPESIPTEPSDPAGISGDGGPGTGIPGEDAVE